MEVRKLNANEHFEADLISHVAFHMRMEDPEKVREESLKTAEEDWGAFAPDGQMMARIINNRFDTWLDGRKGMNALLGFLGRFTADYSRIRLFLPASLELFSFIRSPQAYDITQTVRQGYMIRPINARRLLEIIRKPEDGGFAIRIGDDAYIPENNGTWEVRGNRAVPTDREPDLSVSIQAFGQLAAGCVSLDEARYRPDVTVTGRGDALAKIFVRKPILVEEQF